MKLTVNEAASDYTDAVKVTNDISLKNVNLEIDNPKDEGIYADAGDIIIEGSSVKIDSESYKGKKIRTVTIGKNVTKIKANAFKGSPATKLILKTKLLKKKTVKNALKGSKIKTAQVKVGKSSTNKKIKKAYKKFFTKKVLGRNVKLK